ncbi:hypothetical protein NDU88_008554 [Pleurodeles waltl]|uniref:Pol-like protein n=1 Tax=Pleurodeles waltl TaxID=8319 RepID=A0AAV7QNV7_PLEWA|nr:hypothetical protein NDU88_008554 [Pleurodeles waltl]
MLTPRRLQGQFLAAGFTSHSRGILIWASRTSDISLREVAADPGAWYVVAHCSGSVLSFLLMDIYGPNYDDPQFYSDLAVRADSWGGLPQLWCGDFNCTLNPTLDRSVVRPIDQKLRRMRY